MVAGVPRGIRKSIGDRGRDQSDGDELSIVRWRREFLRVDEGYGAVRSWPVCRTLTTWGHRGVRVGEATNPGPKEILLRKRDQQTVLDSDSDDPLIDRGRFGLLSSDDEEVSSRVDLA